MAERSHEIFRAETMLSQIDLSKQGYITECKVPIVSRQYLYTAVSSSLRGRLNKRDPYNNEQTLVHFIVLSGKSDVSSWEQYLYIPLYLHILN